MMCKVHIGEAIIDIIKIILMIIAIILMLSSPLWTPYLSYKYDVWKSPCSMVYNNGELIYEGNSYFYETESRGNSTIFKEYDKTFFFPKMKKEIMSNKLEIKTCGEKQ